MAARNDEQLFDARLIQQRIRRGTITPELYQKYLDALPDDAANAEETSTRFVDAFSHRTHETFERDED